MYLPIDRGFDRKFSLYFRNKVTGRLVVQKIGRSRLSFMLYSSFTIFIISWFCDKNSLSPELESLLDLMR